MSRYPIRMTVILSLVFTCASALAQPTGLRLTPQFGVYENPVGLKLHLVDSHSQLFSSDESYLAAPAETNLNHSRTSTALITDWQLNSNGLRASAGLVLRYKQTSLLNEETARRQDIFQSSPETYIGLGWNSEPFGAKSWSFSADVGSFVSSRTRSGNAVLGLQQDGNGIHWTPYLSIGAQLNY